MEKPTKTKGGGKVNKRIKLKKGILQKKCDDRCVCYRTIVNEKFCTNNICIGCIHKTIADELITNNCKAKGVIRITL